MRFFFLNCSKFKSPSRKIKRAVVFVLLARASKTYIGSVLFRTSAYTGAKQANRVPTGSKQDNSPHNDDVKDVSVLLESELIGSV